MTKDRPEGPYEVADPAPTTGAAAPDPAPTTGAAEPPPPSRARIATSAVFVIHAMLFASWTPHVVLVKDHLGLSDGTLGLALLGAPVGAIVANALIGIPLGRWGSRPTMCVTMIGYAVCAPAIGLAGSAPQLFAALIGLGAFQGSLDVAMNAQAIAIERRYPRPILSSFHAWWSLGAFGGSGLGIAAIALGLGLATQFAILGAAALLMLPILLAPLLRGDRSNASHGLALPWGNRRLLLIGGIMFAALLCEGAASDWASVYLRDSLAAPAEVAGLGYAVFAAAMFVGRSRGDRWTARYGGGRVVAALALAGAAGLGGALVLGHVGTALAGFAVYGLGLACIVPVCFTAVAAHGGHHPGHDIAAVDTAGRTGFLLGPAAIGTLSEATSLPLALALLPLLCLVIAVAARSLPRTTPAGTT